MTLKMQRTYAATFPNSEVTAIHKAPSDYPGGKQGDVITVEFNVLGILASVSTAARYSNIVRLFHSKSQRTIKKRLTATGTQSSAMAARKVSVVGAKTAGVFPGKLLHER